MWNIRYKDTRAGTPTVTAAYASGGTDLGSDTHQVTVLADPIVTVEDMPYTEDAAASAIDASATASDDNGDGDWDTGAKLEVQVTVDSHAGDEISIDTSGNFSISSGDLSYGATVIGSVSETSGTANDGMVTGGDKLTVNFTASATSAIVQDLVRAILYRSTSDNPTESSATRTVTVTLTDKDAGTGSDTSTITITPVNDAPVAVADTYTVAEGGTLEPTGGFGSEVKLTAEGGAMADCFGFSVSVSGDWAVISGVNSMTGAKIPPHVFHNDGGAWEQAQTLTATGGSEYDGFGSSVSISGDYAVIGAEKDDSGKGAAYVFRNVAGTWSQTQKLTATGGSEYDAFGLSVSVSGDYAIIGAQNDDSGKGSAYVFQNNGGTWGQVAKLTADDGAGADFFGCSVSISGDYAVIGAYQNFGNIYNSGSAYVFKKPGSGWENMTESAKLTASDGESSDSFGQAVSVLDDWAIIGAGYNNDGSAYVFQNNGGTWEQVDKLTADDAAASDKFGLAVSISGDRVVIGASGDEDNQGSAYAFHYDGETWEQVDKLTASDGAAGSYFGNSVSVSGDYAVIGAYSDDSWKGAAYFFTYVPGSVLANDTDGDDDELTAEEVDGPQHASSFTLNEDGTFTYVHDGGEDTTDSFTYKVYDGTDYSDPATVTITITPVNDPPTLTAFTAAVDGTAEDTEVEITLNELKAQGDEADVDGPVDAFVVQSVTGGTLNIGTDAQSAAAFVTGSNDTIDGTNHAYWTPAQGATSTLEAFTVTAQDDSGAESTGAVGVEVSVSARPTLTAFSAAVDTTDEDIEVEITFDELADKGDEADPDVGGYVAAFVVQSVAGGTLEIGSSAGAATLFAAGTNDTIDENYNAYWTPTQDANGTLDAFAVVAQDNDGVESSTGVTAQVTVTPVNDAPAVVGDSYTVAEGGTLEVTGGSTPVKMAGEAPYDHFGSSVSINNDGTIVAIGAPFNDDNGSQAGQVRVYEYQLGTWMQIGPDINGESAGDQSGTSVALNGDGSIVAIGASMNHGDNGAISGHVRVYENVSGTWIQVGSDIDGETHSNRSGSSVAINDDGTIVAIGAPTNYDKGVSAGHVRVYKNQSGTWTQVGLDIDGEGPNNYFGRSIAINDAGTIVAIGATSGHVRVFENVSDTWTQVGSDIDGEAAGDYFGKSVSMNNDGTIVAIGAPKNDDIGVDAGHVRVYENVSGTWTQVGADIDGEAAGDQFGISVSISGERVVAGAFYADSQAGATYVFENQDGTWTQIEKLTASEPETYDEFGISVAVSGDRVVVGAEYDDTAGAAYVFDLSSPSSGEGTLLANDTDVEGSQLTAEKVTEPSHGTVMVNEDGTFTYVHDGGEDTNDSFTYKVYDGTDYSDPATVTITITPVNDPPTLTAFTAAVDGTAEDTEVEITLNELKAQGDEADVDGTVDAFVVQSVSSGTLKIGTNAQSTEAFAADTNDTIDAANHAYWTPAQGATGTLEAFTVTAQDDGGAESTGAVAVEVNISARPTLTAFSAAVDTTEEDTEVEITFDELAAQGNEEDADGMVVAFVVQSVAGGTLEIGSSADAATLFAAGSNDTVDASTNAYWTPPQDANGTLDAFAVRAQDNDGVESSTDVTVQVNVTPVNDAPAAAAESYTVAEGGTLEPTGGFGEEVKCIDDDGEGNDWLSCSVSVSGDWAVIGAFGDDDKAPGSGAAYIFHNDGATWSQTKKLTASGDTGSGSFGYSVSISGDYAVIGAYLEESYKGAAYVFYKDKSGVGEWGQVARLTAENGAAGDYFGISVSISGDWVVIGAKEDDDIAYNAGAAYVFKKPDTGWEDMTETQKLTADNGAENDEFGDSVSVSGGYAAIGAYKKDTSKGAAYIFQNNGGTWEQVARLTGGGGYESFGCSVSVSDNYAVIGAENYMAPGSVYVFKKPDTVWENTSDYTAKLTGPAATFGSAVSVSGDRIVIGYPYDDDKASNAGAAYFYQNNGVTWEQVQKITAEDGAYSDTFGNSVSVSDGYAVIGASGYDDDKGSAYFFTYIPGSITSTATDAEGDALTAEKVDDPSHGSVTVNEDGTFTYVHDGSETTTDSFTYRVYDGTAYSDPVTVTITITPVNDDPVLAANEPLSVSPNATVTVTGSYLEATDVDNSADQLTFTVGTEPDYGTLFVDANENGEADDAAETITGGETFTQDDIGQGLLKYTHNGTAATSDSFSFTVDDGDDGTIDSEDFIFIFNELPTLDGFSGVLDTTVEDTEIEITYAELEAAGDEADTDGTVEAFVVKSVTTGTLKIGASSGAAAAWAAGTNDTIDASNHAYWTPAQDANGSSLDAFAVRAQDDKGSESAGDVTVQVDVTPVNDAPALAVNAGLTVAEGGSGIVTTAELNEADLDDGGTGLTYTVTGLPDHGDLVVNGTTLEAGSTTFTQADIDNSLLSYTHDGGETTEDTFTFGLADGGEDGAQALTGQTFIITVTPVNDPPVLSDVETAAATFVAEMAPVAVTGTVTISDQDHTVLQSATLAVTANYEQGQDVLLFTDTGAITHQWTASTGVLTLTGEDTLANWEAALQAVAFNNTLASPVESTRTVSITVSDGENDSNTVTRDVAVITDIWPPVIVPGPTPPGVQAFDDDSDGDPGYGFIDRIVITYDEPLDETQGDLSDWIIYDADGVTDLLDGLDDSAVTISGNTLTITLADNSGTTGEPFYQYSEDGDGGAIQDPYGNEKADVSNNTAPSAAAGDDIETLPRLVRLNASGSSDPDGNEITCTWTQDDGPFDLGITGAEYEEIAFAGRAKGTYTFTLTAADPFGAEDEDTVLVTILNGRPMAKPGRNRAVDKDDDTDLDVVLEGAASRDPNSYTGYNDIVDYEWQWTSGPQEVALIQDGTVQPLRVRPKAGPKPAQEPVTRAGFDTSDLGPGAYTFTLTVTDADGLTGEASVEITVNDPDGNGIPVADAGMGMQQNIGARITLDGHESKDPDGDPLTYRWEQVSGATVKIMRANKVKAMVRPTKPGTYVFRLIVNDGQADSAPSFVTVEMVDPKKPLPVAEILVDGAVRDTWQFAVGEEVTLDGTVLGMDEGDVTPAWSQVRGTTLTIDDPAVWDLLLSPVEEGVYGFRLDVSVSADGATGRGKEITVTVLGDSVPPVADAGTDQLEIMTGDLVTLDGSGSYDDDPGDVLDYTWTQLLGPAMQLSDPYGAQPTFTPGDTGACLFQLTVFDGDYESAPDLVYVVVHSEDEHVPTAKVIEDTITNGKVGNLVIMNGTPSSDSDSQDTLVYQWVQTGGPMIVLDDPYSAVPSFTPSLEGNYAFTLYVDDSRDRSVGQTVTVTVGPAGAVEPGSSETGPGNASCFIATAAYGTPFEADVVTLRRFRDKALLPTEAGTRLVELYYRCSPPVADIIARDKALRRLVRTILSPVVRGIELSE